MYKQVVFTLPLSICMIHAVGEMQKKKGCEEPLATTAEVDCVGRRVGSVENDVGRVKKQVAMFEGEIAGIKEEADRQSRRVGRVEGDVRRMGRRFEAFEDSTRQMNRQVNQRFDRVEEKVQTLQEQQQTTQEQQHEIICKLIDVLKTPRIKIAITMTAMEGLIRVPYEVL